MQAYVSRRHLALDERIEVCIWARRLRFGRRTAAVVVFEPIGAVIPFPVAAVMASPFAVLGVLDRAACVERIDAGVEELLGAEPAVLHGRPFRTLVHPDDAAQLDTRWDPLGPATASSSAFGSTRPAATG